MVDSTNDWIANNYAALMADRQALGLIDPNYDYGPGYGIGARDMGNQGEAIHAKALAVAPAPASYNTPRETGFVPLFGVAQSLTPSKPTVNDGPFVAGPNEPGYVAPPYDASKDKGNWFENPPAGPSFEKFKPGQETDQDYYARLRQYYESPEGQAYQAAERQKGYDETMRIRAQYGLIDPNYDYGPGYGKGGKEWMARNPGVAVTPFDSLGKTGGASAGGGSNQGGAALTRMPTGDVAKQSQPINYDGVMMPAVAQFAVAQPMSFGVSANTAPTPVSTVGAAASQTLNAGSAPYRSSLIEALRNATNNNYSNNPGVNLSQPSINPGTLNLRPAGGVNNPAVLTTGGGTAAPPPSQPPKPPTPGSGTAGTPANMALGYAQYWETKPVGSVTKWAGGTLTRVDANSAYYTGPNGERGYLSPNSDLNLLALMYPGIAQQWLVEFGFVPTQPTYESGTGP